MFVLLSKVKICFKVKKEIVIITGGSGLIGGHLTQLLQKEGFEVRHMSRSVNSKYGVKTFVWDLKQKTIDDNALKDVDYIIHLAGAGITDKPWTNKFRKLIVTSRIDGIPLIKNALLKLNHQPKAFISASGINIYGSQSILENVTEEFPAKDDFLAKTCVYWENYTDTLSDITRVVKLRTGIVLDKHQGALPKLSESFKYGMGAALGSGKQFMSWIHIEDLCQMYLFAIKNEHINGAYNACSDEKITNEQFSETLAQVIRKKMWLPKIPSWFLKVLFGDMADIFLYGNHCTSKKIQNEGFKFKYNQLKSALIHLLEK